MGPPQHVKQPDDKPEAFLVEEYKNLFAIDAARNERLDRFFTLFLSVAGGPWVLYAIVIKDKGSFTLTDMPPLVAAAFLGAGFLGFVVVMMLIQTRFMIVGYMRAVNAIRKHFAEKRIEKALLLPTSPERPLYYERGSFVTIGAVGMGLGNASYVTLAIYRLLQPQEFWRWTFVLVAGASWLIIHINYYRFEAEKREERTRTGKMKFETDQPKKPRKLFP